MTQILYNLKLNTFWLSTYPVKRFFLLFVSLLLLLIIYWHIIWAINLLLILWSLLILLFSIFSLIWHADLFLPIFILWSLTSIQKRILFRFRRLSWFTDDFLSLLSGRWAIFSEDWWELDTIRRIVLTAVCILRSVLESISLG